MNHQLILKHFPQLSDSQIEKFSKLQNLYESWNEKINVISRKDTQEFYERHVLHSLGIAKILQFSAGTKILDIGTGGGFPGIPLAILFPEVQFTLVDSIGKKITVVQAIADELGLENVTAIHERAENIKGKFHFVVSRAVTQMPVFLTWLQGKFEKEQINPLENGILYLKGGDLSQELAGLKTKEHLLKDYFEEDFFETKKVVYLSAKNFKN